MFGRGKVIVKPYSARLSRDTEWFGQMDPYCVVKLGKQTLKTNVHKRAGRFPTWDSVLEFDRVNEDSILIECWDKDKLKKDDLIGSVEFALQPVFTNFQYSDWITMVYKKKVAGQINIQFEFVPSDTSFLRHVKPPEELNYKKMFVDYNKASSVSFKVGLNSNDRGTGKEKRKTMPYIQESKEEGGKGVKAEGLILDRKNHDFDGKEKAYRKVTSLHHELLRTRDRSHTQEVASHRGKEDMADKDPLPLKKE